MAIIDNKLVCDLCMTDVKGDLDAIGQMQEKFRVPGVVKDVCAKCGTLVDRKLAEIRAHHENDIAEEFRQFLLANHNNPKFRGVLPSKSRILH